MAASFGSTRNLRLAPGGASSVPSQQCVGCDEPAIASWPGECGGDCAEECPVIVVEGWSVYLSAEHSELVAHHDDLEVFASSGTDRETGQRGDEAVQNSVHGPPGSVDVSPGQPPRPSFRPRRASALVSARNMFRAPIQGALRCAMHLLMLMLHEWLNW